MKTTDNILTREELEQLCQLFLDGRLSVAEEKDLGVVISASEERGGIIDDTLFLLGLERIRRDSSIGRESEGASAGNSVVCDRKLTSSLIRILAVGSCAAAIILTLSVCWNMLYNPRIVSQETTYTAYVNGREVTDQTEARRIALQSYESSMAFIAEMKALESEKMNEVRLLKGMYDDAITKQAASVGKLKKTNQINS